MENIEGCSECHRNILKGYICDNCEKSTEKGNYISITVSFGYGSGLDGMECHFCNKECLLEFIRNEIKKENNKNV